MIKFSDFIALLLCFLGIQMRNLLNKMSSNLPDCYGKPELAIPLILKILIQTIFLFRSAGA
jgi:hypothetical protein